MIGHSLDYTFIILPIFSQFVEVHRCLPALKAEQKAFILILDGLYLFAAHDIIQTFVGFCIDTFGTRNRVISLG